MKIQVDGKIVHELNETQKKVIQSDIPSEIFQEDMERRAKWVIEHKYDRCFDRLKREWEPKLAKTHASIPTDKDSFAELVFSLPEYKSRSQKELEAKQEEHRRRTGQ